MMLCTCKGLSESEVKELLKTKSIEDIIKETGITTDCGICLEEIKKYLKSLDNDQFVQED